ncbi:MULTISPECIES: hypothetical protein [Nocardiopsis]|jgi:hypothetical protein|uniref:Uncharacterized protein n=2 Tax=Nocardiopsis alba TaxID=53437 RepID=A0A7K2IUH4_9ACTN|nr:MULTISPECIES: hypothetical protein [Nocardiopsis]AFR08786.1 hypothetical protein B005_2648 [Nocardiopsis alba ATCC BAA-2165]MEC3894724.1 hypothetical protein [Nocardiopsis sp. LDBS1602]MYR33474.1 hypothetical protein [Nocardiopsis alba]
MKRIASVSGLILATGLALGAMSGTAAADNNANIQNITVPICADVIAFTGFSSEGCNVISNDIHSGIAVLDH